MSKTTQTRARDIHPLVAVAAAVVLAATWAVVSSEFTARFVGAGAIFSLFLAGLLAVDQHLRGKLSAPRCPKVQPSEIPVARAVVACLGILVALGALAALVAKGAAGGGVVMVLTGAAVAAGRFLTADAEEPA